MFQTLEPRRLLSAVAAPNVETNVVTVSGTDADDFITITRRGNELLVTLGGERFTFDASVVQRVEVFAGGGDDRIVGTRSGLPLHVEGEAGDDVILGGSADDHLSGGEGQDQILGRGGNDTLVGDEGSDSLFGGDGHDVLLDTAGDDYLVGNRGNDTFEDRDGVGRASGGAGADAATVFSDRYRIVSIETVSFAPGAINPAAQPQIHLYAQRSPDGLVTIFVEATHVESGLEKEFGSARRVGHRFETTVSGVDVAADPGAPRMPVLDVATQPYELGRLAPGAYTFTVLSGFGEVRAVLTFGVTTTGLTPETATTPSPTGPGILLPAKRVRGSVTGPGGGTAQPPTGTERPPGPDTPTLGIGNSFLPPTGVSPPTTGVSPVVASRMR